MTETQKINLKGAIQALRDNPLKARGEMKNSQGGRCCLCVMDDYAKQHVTDVEYCDRRSLFPDKKYFNEVYGFDPKWPVLPFNGYMYDLAVFNDGSDFLGILEHTHKEIADLLEKRFFPEVGVEA